MYEEKEITQEQAIEIIETRLPLGRFYHKSENGYVAIDNTDGQAWTEDFLTFEQCIRYLHEKEGV